MAAPRRVPNAPHGADQTRAVLHFGCAAVARTVSPQCNRRATPGHDRGRHDNPTTQLRFIPPRPPAPPSPSGRQSAASDRPTQRPPSKPLSGRLTYALWIGENPDIFVAAADGAEEVQLTADPNRVLCPAFAPDGTAIVFCSDRSGAFEIWMMNSDGTDQRQITRTGGRMLLPKVSPDGTVIVSLAHPPPMCRMKRATYGW